MAEMDFPNYTKASSVAATAVAATAQWTEPKEASGLTYEFSSANAELAGLVDAIRTRLDCVLTPDYDSDKVADSYPEQIVSSLRGELQTLQRLTSYLRTVLIRIEA